MWMTRLHRKVASEGTVIGPILAYFFRNTPYFEGETNPWPLLRQRMWDYLDFQRTNVLPGLFDDRYGWEITPSTCCPRRLCSLI